MTLQKITPTQDHSYNTYTYEWVAPEGDVFVKIARQNGDVWIDTSVGKAGTAMNADAWAICALAGQALRGGIDPFVIVKTLKGITHDKTNYLLARSPNGALSVADAIGRSIEIEYSRGEH